MQLLCNMVRIMVCKMNCTMNCKGGVGPGAGVALFRMTCPPGGRFRVRAPGTGYSARETPRTGNGTSPEPAARPGASRTGVRGFPVAPGVRETPGRPAGGFGSRVAGGLPDPDPGVRTVPGDNPDDFAAERVADERRPFPTDRNRDRFGASRSDGFPGDPDDPGDIPDGRFDRIFHFGTSPGEPPGLVGTPGGEIPPGVPGLLPGTSRSDDRTVRSDGYRPGGRSDGNVTVRVPGNRPDRFSVRAGIRVRFPGVRRVRGPGRDTVRERVPDRPVFRGDTPADFDIPDPEPGRVRGAYRVGFRRVPGSGMVSRGTGSRRVGVRGGRAVRFRSGHFGTSPDGNPGRDRGRPYRPTPVSYPGGFPNGIPPGGIFRPSYSGFPGRETGYRTRTPVGGTDRSAVPSRGVRTISRAGIPAAADRPISRISGVSRTFGSPARLQCHCTAPKSGHLCGSARKLFSQSPPQIGAVCYFASKLSCPS